MSNLDKYNKVFREVFELEIDQLNESLSYQSVSKWDSVGHMAMVALLEEEFDIMMDTDDIIDFSSYEKGKEILAKYEVVL